MQALEDSVCAAFLLCFVGHVVVFSVARNGIGAGEPPLHSPEPTQYIHRKHRNARSGGNASERLFRTGFPVRKAVSTDDDCYEACNLGDRAGE